MNPTVLAGAAAQLTTRNISRAAFLLTAFMLLQKLLALGQQVLIGRVIGLSAEADAFYIAQTVPLLVGAWIMASLTNTLIPMLRTGDSRRTAGLLLSILALLALSTLALFVCGGWVVGVLGHGLAPATARMSVRLLREMTILIFLMGATGILNALYYRYSRFLVPSIASCLLYVGAIGGVFLKPWLGVDGFAWGVVAGAIGQVVMLCWFVGPQDLRQPQFDGKQLAGFGKSFSNILVTLAVSAFCVIVDRAFASSGRAGTVTGVTLASNLMTIPSAMVVTSLNSALLPAFVQAREDKGAFAALFRHALVYMIFFIGPGSLILFFGSEPLVRLLFHSGKFDAHAVHVTAGLLTAYSVGIFGMALKDVFSNALIALGREWIAMLAGVLSLGASIALKLIYLNPEYPTWIATSTSIAMWIGAVLLLASVPVEWMRFWREQGWRLVLVNGLFVAVCVALWSWIQSGSTWQPLAALTAAAAVYLVSAWMLRLNEQAGLRLKWNASARIES
ncbi:MAG: murein biosynthesis integral membrane protein MurJ [Bryobacteraceae bacterium]